MALSAPPIVKERHRDKDAGRIRLVRCLQQSAVADQGWHLCSNGVETLHQTGVPHKMAVFWRTNAASCGSSPASSELRTSAREQVTRAPCSAIRIKGPRSEREARWCSRSRRPESGFLFGSRLIR